MKPNLREYITAAAGGDAKLAAAIEGVLERLAVDFLTLRDWSLIPSQSPGDFDIETPGQFQERLKISASHFARRLLDPRCPALDYVENGPTGRIKTLRSNLAFERFMQKATTTIERQRA